jgi:cell division protein FtsA
VKATYLAALDIGTTKLCCVAARVTKESAEIMGFHVVASAGIRRGVIVDMRSAQDAIRHAITACEQESGLELGCLQVGISGDHVRFEESYGTTGIRGGTVAQRDVDRVMESAGALYVPLDREILHLLPMEYRIDDQGGIFDPEGMAGVRLEASVGVVTASHAAVENISCCVERAGVRSARPMFGPLASALAVLTEREMGESAVVIDMGGGTTDIALYQGGTLRHAASIPLGGQHMTNDVAIGLRVSPEEAERVKKSHGTALPGNGSNETMQIHSLDGVRRNLKKSMLGEILMPRSQEIFCHVRGAVEAETLYGAPTAVVLTGGASQLAGLDQVAEAVLGLPVRVGGARSDTKLPLDAELRNPAYATAVGLVLAALDEEGAPAIDICGRVLDTCQKWYRGLMEVKQWGLGVR